MTDDPRIQWTLANSYGIWMDKNPGLWSPDHADSPADQWNAGRTTDVLVRPDGNLVVAAAQGGVWLISDGGTVCASDRWEHAIFGSLAQGPDDDQHIFAGGADAALYMTDVSRLTPLLDWIRLDSLRKTADPVGEIHDILVLRQARVVVLACDGGIFWSRIPPKPARLGPPATDSFKWFRAFVERDLPNGFLSLAEGPPPPGTESHPDGLIVETIMAGGLGDPSPAGLFWGKWEKPDVLVFRRSYLFNQSTNVTLISAVVSRSVVTSFPPNRFIGYAACAATYTDSLLVLFKTVDGGRTWNAVDPRIPGFDSKKRLADALGSTQNGRNFCIAVSNTDSDILTLGFRNGAISFDGGRNWRIPGFDPTQANSLTDHIHPDVSNYAFARTTPDQPVAPEAYYVSSDGGVAQVAWGEGASVIESDVHEHWAHGNFYAAVLDGSTLVLHVRHSGTAILGWQVESVITQKATGRACLIQSDFRTGTSFNGNLEVIVPEGSDLVHYSCAIQNGHYTNWIRQRVITHLATGPGCLIQSDFNRGSNGNFEVLALEGNELVHYWLDGANPNSSWNQGATISNQATGPGCLIQSTFGSHSSIFVRHGNLEVIVLEGIDLVHYWHDSSALSAPWSSRTVIHRSDGAGCFFQSDFADSGGHGNFELVFRLDNVLMFSFRDNNAPGFPWSIPVPITPMGRKASGPGCMFQSSYGTSDHGNFELFVPEGAVIAHYFRNNSQCGFPWKWIASVTESAFTFRSDFNRKLPTLQVFPQFGGSMLESRALIGALQDNGTVDGIAGANGTPWLQLESGDGIAAFYLSGHSPRISGNLAAGRTAVHQNNEEADGDPSKIRGSKSAHWQSSARKLVLDNHGKGGSVIPLLLPKPRVTPVPDPDEGLRKPAGIDTLYHMVRSPENFPKALILAALAAQGPDLYVLLVGQNQTGSHQLHPLDMHWEFQHTFTQATKVNAMASGDGLTAIVELAETGIPPGSGPNFYRLDLSTGKVDPMPVDGDPTKGLANSIAIVSPNEAYAAVTSIVIGVAALPGLPPAISQHILCWSGAKWIERGQPPRGADEGSFISVEVDPSQTPATVFVATAGRVYVSRDSAKTWTRASKGLPEAVPCKALRWVRDPLGAHVYLATYGRSIWNISREEGTW